MHDARNRRRHSGPSQLRTPRRAVLVGIALIALAPVLTGARGEGCAPVFSQTPAPDVTGQWAVTYDDTLEVEITIGGAVYTEEIGVEGGAFTIEHEGRPLTFDLDCTRPEIICPSEVFPETVRFEQRNALYPHRMYVMLPTQVCDGETVPAELEECGAGTLNEDCEDVCLGEMVPAEEERFGVISEDGSGFELWLGAGVATNGINCALLGTSVADGDLLSTGTSDEGNWEATAVDAGVLTVAYAGGCLWAGDPDDDGELEAIVLGAGITFRTGFTATKS